MSDFPTADAPVTDLWTRLAAADKPLVLYGMGDGADKITDELARRGLSVADYFASDSFVRGQFFRGKRVMTLSEIREKYASFIVLVAFASSRPEVIEQIRALDRTCELYLPDVPVVGEGIFDARYYEKNLSFLKEAREALFDEESRLLFDNVIAFKLSGRFLFLERAVSDKNEILTRVLRPERYRVCADLGAYTGDSVREFLRCFPHLSRILALEPDIRNFKKLTRYVEENALSFVEAYNLAAGAENGEVLFLAGGNRGARTERRAEGKAEKETGGGRRIKGNSSVRVCTLDSLLLGEQVDFIKYDVEGNEYEALQGSLSTIRKYAPDLLVSLYHRNEDLFRLILLVKSFGKHYRLYLRRFAGFPAWDLNLYAVSER